MGFIIIFNRIKGDLRSGIGYGYIFLDRWYVMTEKYTEMGVEKVALYVNFRRTVEEYLD